MIRTGVSLIVAAAVADGLNWVPPLLLFLLLLLYDNDNEAPVDAAILGEL